MYHNFLCVPEDYPLGLPSPIMAPSPTCRRSRCSHLIPRGINLSSDDGDVILLENAWHEATSMVRGFHRHGARLHNMDGLSRLCHGKSHENG